MNVNGSDSPGLSETRTGVHTESHGFSWVAQTLTLRNPQWIPISSEALQCVMSLSSSVHEFEHADSVVRVSVWLIILINLAGTVFGFWHYRFQLMNSHLAIWPAVPDSPLATLCMSLSLISWRVGKDRNWIHALAFYGNLKYGFWVVIVQLLINDALINGTPYQLFLLVSHFGMGIQAVIIYRYATFSVPSVAVATAWFSFNDVVDFFIPIVGEYHHTYFGPDFAAASHDMAAHDIAAAAAVCLTVLATFSSLSIRVRQLSSDRHGPP